MQKFKFLEHTADIKFQAFGKSLEEAFENSAYALKEIMHDKLKIKAKIKKKIKVNGKDKEALLYNFLEEFLFLLDSEDFVLSKIKKINIKNISTILDNNKTNKASKHKLALKISKDNDKGDNKEQYNHNKEYKLNAEVIGDKAENYNFTNNVKAITYNEMKIWMEKNKYKCQVVVDV